MALNGEKLNREELYLELTQVAGPGHTTKVTGQSYMWMFASDVIVFFEILPDSAEALYGKEHT